MDASFNRAGPAALGFWTAAIALVLAPPRILAQSAQGPSGTAIALVDMNKVFQNHMRFKAAMDDLKKDITNYEAGLGDQRKQAAHMNEQLANYRPGTPEYKQVESQLAQLAANAQVGMAMQKKEFLEREAKVYYQAYMEVAEQVNQIAARNNIALVLSYNGEPINAEDRASILQGVNRAVVYQRELDITPLVLERLNRGAMPAAMGARPAIPQRR